MQRKFLPKVQRAGRLFGIEQGRAGKRIVHPPGVQRGGERLPKPQPLVDRHSRGDFVRPTTHRTPNAEQDTQDHDARKPSPFVNRSPADEQSLDAVQQHNTRPRKGRCRPGV